MNGSPTNTTTTPDRCPLCGAANNCALATGPSASPVDCWCFHTRVDDAALAQIPPDAVDKACLCPICARRDDARRSDARRDDSQRADDR